ncbi:hypothetical protein [Nocardia sp. CA-290969]
MAISTEKFTPAEEAWLAEVKKGWAPLDAYQAMIIRRHFRTKPPQQEGRT